MRISKGRWHLRVWLLLSLVVCLYAVAQEPVLHGELTARITSDLRREIEPVNRRVLGVCMLHTDFTPEIAREMKSFLDESSVRIWLHKGYDQAYMQNIMNTVKESGAKEIFAFVPLCRMPNLVARYDSEDDNNLVRDQQMPQYYARLLEFLNTKAQKGFASGYGIDVFEVWNEPEYPQNGAWPAHDYARYAVDVSKRIREKDPLLQIGACVRPDKNWPGWNRKMLMEVARRDVTAINALISHPYDFFWIRATPKIGRYWAVVGGMENHRKQLQSYIDLAREIGHGRWRLALTEWNTHPPTYKPPTTVSRDLPAAINMAGAIQMFWEIGVDSAQYFLAHSTERKNGILPHFALIHTLKDGSLQFNPTYKVLKLIGENARGVRMQSSTESAEYDYPAGKEAVINKIKIVTGTCIYDFENKELRILAVNRHIDKAIKTEFDIRNFKPDSVKAVIEILSGDTPEAEFANVVREEFALPEKFTGKFEKELPPHSVSIIRIKGIRPLTEEERVSRLLNMIRGWNICGVFPAVNNKLHGLDKTLACESDEVDFAKKFTGFAKSEAMWQTVQANAGGYVDFTANLRILGLDQKITNNLQGYAQTYLYSPAKQELTFSLGADYWAVVKVNGKTAIDMTVNPGGQPAADRKRGKIMVEEGWNKVEVRVASGSEGMGFWLGVEDPGGIITRPALSKPDKEPASSLKLKPVACTYASSWKDTAKNNFAEVKWAEVSGNKATARYSYIKWKLPDGIKSDDIVGAKIILVQKFAMEKGEVRLGKVESEWQEKTLSWNSRPKSVKLIKEAVSTKNGVWQFAGDQLRDIVKGWAEDSSTNHGVFLMIEPKYYKAVAGFVSDNNAKDYPVLSISLKENK